jgi:hypothetical protein
VRLDLGDRVVAVVEDRCAQHGVGTSLQRIDEVVERARATGGDHRHVDRLGDGMCQLKVVAGVRAVTVHRREQDLPRSPLDSLASPADHVAPGRRAPSGDEDLPAGV